MLAEDKTNPDERSGFRYVTVQRRKTLTSSSLYRTARDGTLRRGRRRGWRLSSIQRVFRPLGDRLFSHSRLGEAWNSSFAAHGGHGAFQLHVVLETAASHQCCSSSPACGTSSWPEQELGHTFLLSKSF